MNNTNNPLGQMYRQYAPALDAWFIVMSKRVAERPLLGKNTFETVRNAAVREGYLEALQDLRKEFIDKA
jgi:hypothetical protein